ncbi:7481_t:CDS:2, partial [Entrophospora sp. SA101]
LNTEERQFTSSSIAPRAYSSAVANLKRLNISLILSHFPYEVKNIPMIFENASFEEEDLDVFEEGTDNSINRTEDWVELIRNL